VRDELQQVITVDRRVPEAFPVAEPVRVQAATADLHHRADLALRRQGVGADLPGNRCRVVKGVVKAA
jgi:hypothetical protein